MIKLSAQWDKLPAPWKAMAYKEWLLFLKNKFPLSTFLRDDSYGIDFLLCKALNIESNNPDNDLKQLDLIVSDGLKSINENSLSEIFSMQFLAVLSEITYIAPLKYFPNIKVLDFHCQNESKITDFEILRRDKKIFVLDYADYQIIDFDKFSNIRDIENIMYIKGYGFPSEVNSIYSELKANYIIYE